MADKNKKKKKTKNVYIDDGRTIADMSGLNQKRSGYGTELPGTRSGRGTFKEHMQTYFNACRTMFLPMLATMGIITVAFLILYLILELAS